jgi:hypothetical protein
LTIHKINAPNSDPFFSTFNAANGDIFDLTASGAGMALWNLSNTTIRFMASNQSATLVNTGATKIYDMGTGTNMTFSAGDGLVTIYNFQNDPTGHITEMGTATTKAHLTPSSDGHGGTFLTGVALSIHLVNDPNIAPSQYS